MKLKFYIRTAFFVQFFFLSLPVFSESAEKLLSGFLENDLQLQKYAVMAESKALSLDSAKINNGITVSLSTGEMKIETSKDKNKITVSPNASVEIPQADVSLGVSVPISVSDGDKSVNGKISASVGIISNARKKRKIDLMQAERSYLEAERNVKSRAISAEKEFYNNLKSLYSGAVAVLNARADLYDDTTDLKVLQAQGYSKTSASYRQKNLRVESDRRNVLEKQRIFERETSIFAKKCGISFNRIEGTGNSVEDWIKAGEIAFQTAIDFLPSEIPSKASENIFKYDKNLYTKIEQASWDKMIAELKREANKELTLKFTGEYAFNAKFYSENSDLDSKTDTIGGKFTLGWRGINASAGAYFPVGDSSANPYYAFSLAFSPNDWRLAAISRKQDELNSQLEDISIESAFDDYETVLLDTTSKFHDLKWTERSNKEELITYTNLEADMEKWLKQGIVTENNYLDAKNNKEKARINVITNAIDLLIFNADVRLMFVEKSE